MSATSLRAECHLFEGGVATEIAWNPSAQEILCLVPHLFLRSLIPDSWYLFYSVNYNPIPHYYFVAQAVLALITWPRVSWTCPTSVCMSHCLA